MAKAVVKGTGIDIQEIDMGRVDFYIIGVTPLIMHRFQDKAWRELLLPGQKMNSAAKAENLKHDPLAEFRGCCYKNRDSKEPTLLHIPGGAFSKAMAAAALDLPGASKSQILRLVSLESTQVNLYGIPSLGMDMVRSSDMARTPDVRTRPYFTNWACKITVSFVESLINQKQVANLLGAAGLIVGVGDYRPQKGGSFGKFTMTKPGDPALKLVLKQARKAQEDALREPTFYNDDSRELYAWYTEEVARREKTPPSASYDMDELDTTPKKRKNNGQSAIL